MLRVRVCKSLKETGARATPARLFLSVSLFVSYNTLMLSKPETLIPQFEIREGMHVLDVGAGYGSYSIPIARMLLGYPHNTGHVYALDVQKELLEVIKQKVDEQSLSNLTCLWADIERPSGTNLATGSIDVVLVSHVLFQLEDMASALTEIRRVLKPSGHVCVIEWADNSPFFGKASVSVLAPGILRARFASHGFVFARDLIVSPHQYGMLFVKEK